MSTYQIILTSIDQLIRLIEILAWPVIIVIIVFYAPQLILRLLPYIQKLRFKEIEIWFRESIAEINDEIKQAHLPPEKEPLSKDTKLRAGSNPKLSIMEAWSRLEESARSKVKDLVPKNEKYKDPLDDPIGYLLFKGALPPSAASAAHNLRALRNAAAHAQPGEISPDSAIGYIAISERIRSHIEGIVELPFVKLTALTLVVLQINSLIDSKKYEDISIQDAYEWIERGSVLSSLREKTDGEFDDSIFGPEGPYQNFNHFYNEQMKLLAGGYAGVHARKWGVENLGLCLLLAWTNELIQQGGGWYPNMVQN